MNVKLFRWTESNMGEYFLHNEGGHVAIIHVPSGTRLQIIGSNSTSVHGGDYPEEYIVMTRDTALLVEISALCGVKQPIIMPKYPRQHLRVSSTEWPSVSAYILPPITDADLF